MKLLFVISTLRGGGAEGVLCTLANEMVERGHNVILITTRDCHTYYIDNKVKVIEAINWQYDTFSGSFFSRIYKKVANRFLDFNHLRKIIHEERPQLVLSFLTQWLVSLTILCKGRIPMIFADRNAVQYKFGRFNFIRRQILFRLADVVQVMSYHDKAYLRNRYKIVVPMPNPLRYQPMSLEDYLASFKKRNNLLAVGRLTPQKGFDKLFYAFAKVAQKYPNWDLDICGEDMLRSDYSKRLKKIVNDLGIDNRVHFIGFHKDIDIVMQSHSIFCLSSVHEGFPNVLSEAMANGMACISFDIVTGPHEIIMDGLDGMIVNDQDIDSLAAGLDVMMANEDLRFDYGRRAIENIKRYDKKRIADKWEQLFFQTTRKKL